MTDTSPSSQNAGEQQAGLAPETTRIEVYCHREEKHTWQDEADENGYQSASRYLYALIQKARAYNEGDLPLVTSTSDADLQDLKQEKRELERRLERAREERDEPAPFDLGEIVEETLTTNCQSLDELEDAVMDSEAVRSTIHRQLENELYSRAEGDEIEYQRGHGWRLTEDG